MGMPTRIRSFVAPAAGYTGAIANGPLEAQVSLAPVVQLALPALQAIQAQLVALASPKPQV